MLKDEGLLLRRPSKGRSGRAPAALAHIFFAVLCKPYFLLLGPPPPESAVRPWNLRLLAHRL